jgi:cold shock CspA family protein
MREQGTVVRSEDGLWGFIQSDSRRKIYWHLSEVKDSMVLREFDRVSFEIADNPKGNACRFKAISIEPLTPTTAVL